ncbi:hypothetical protein [Streptomyces sp. NPDC014734]|uniref:hypothetical protein n=1 Tax=Streptomyces sp. NPDC014734 TaxID=3364886 RepID=UPI0036F6EF50
MSHNQPGPYGGQPPQGQPGPYGQQPGPYGAPPPQPQGQPGPYGQPQQPNPYGQPQQGQPGYGYPQQAPPQGVPPQGQPGPYGQPQQPNPYGQQPPAPPYGGQPAYGGMPPAPEQPKKKTGLIIGGVIVALAVIGGGVYFLTSGGASNSDVADSTKGYKLTPAASVDDYKNSTGSSMPSGPVTGEQKTQLEGLAVKNAQQADAQYQSGDKENLASLKSVTLSGFWGEVTDPAKVINNAFENAQSQFGKGDEGMEAKLDGSPRAVTPEGFKGALMKCQDMKVTNKEGDGTPAKGPKEFTIPICVWADYSTIGTVFGIDTGLALTGKGMAQDDMAALTAKLYNTSRTKI